MDKTDYTKQVLAGLSSATKTIKNFTLTNNVPTWLAEGEIAVNIIDKKLWVGNTLNTPILLINSATTPSAQGSNTQIQFNDGGVIGAHAGLTYNKTTSTLTATNIVGLTSVTGNAGTATNVAYSGLTGIVPTWNQSTTGNALTSTTAGTVTTAAQPAITSVGILTGLTVYSTIAGSITGNAATATTAGTVTNPNLTGEVTTSGLTATVANSAVISKVLTGYTKSSGAIVSTDTILQAIQKLEGNVSTIDGGFPSDNYSNITTIDGGTP